MNTLLPALASLLVAFVPAALEATNAAEPVLQVRQRSLDLRARLDYGEGALTGRALIVVENVSSDPAREVPLNLNRLMTVSQVTDENGQPLDFSQDVVTFVDQPRRQVNHVAVLLPAPMPPKGTATVIVDYAGFLVGYTETGSLYIRDRIDERFTILREDALAFPVAGLPSRRANRAAKRLDFNFEASITVPERLTVASGGELVRRTVDDGLATYVYRSTAPVPFLNLPIAEYGVREAQGIRVYHFPEDAAGAERVLERSLQALRLLGDWFGPLDSPPRFAIMEIPEGWGSQANLAGGIIQTADAFRAPDSLRELYHELSHLWNVPDTDRPSPRWNEGLAMFLQCRLAQELDGWDGMETYVERVADRLLEDTGSDPDYRDTPFVRYGEAALTDYSYDTGLLMFYVLQQVAGDPQLLEALGGYYRRYRKTGGSFEELVRHLSTATGLDLAALFDDWVYTTRWRDRLRGRQSMKSLAESYLPGSEPLIPAGGTRGRRGTR